MQKHLTRQQIRKARTFLIRLLLVVLLSIIVFHVSPVFITATAIYLGYVTGMRREADRKATRKVARHARPTANKTP